MGRPKASEPAVTRERVLEGAAKLFGVHGYHGTTLAAIGRELDVSGAALYYHFDSKEAILFAYLEAGLEQVTEVTEAALTADDPTERLRQFMTTYVLFGVGELPGSDTYATGVFGYFQLVAALSEDRAKVLVKMQRRYLDLVREILCDGIEAGQFIVADRSATAFAFVGMAAHAVHWFRPGHGLAATQLAELYSDLAVNMVQVPQ